MKKKSAFRILGETVASRPDLAGDAPDPDAENPYWTFDEQEPHPNPELGCIRRGLCCKSSPGWYAPGEAEKSAELLGLSPDEFVRRYLVVDHIEVDGQAVHVFAPVKLGIDGKPAIPPASRADTLYRALRGTCIFFRNDGCSIYAARPYECRAYICTNKPADNPSHEAIARMWLAPAGDES
jgi:Fe-S-cluster containining protein